MFFILGIFSPYNLAGISQVNISSVNLFRTRTNELLNDTISKPSLIKNKLDGIRSFDKAYIPHYYTYGNNSIYSELKYHVGVLSTAGYLKTRASDVYNTWGAQVKSISFYIGNNTENYDKYLPVIQLNGKF